MLRYTSWLLSYLQYVDQNCLIDEKNSLFSYNLQYSLVRSGGREDMGVG